MAQQHNLLSLGEQHGQFCKKLRKQTDRGIEPLVLAGSSRDPVHRDNSNEGKKTTLPHIIIHSKIGNTRFSSHL